MNLSDYLENKLLDHIFRGTALPSPTKVYLALFTSDPTDANQTTREVNTTEYPAYRRQDVAVGGTNAAAWTAPNNGVTKNVKPIVFPTMDGSGAVTVTHFGLYDAPTGGNLLMHGSLNQKTLEATDTVSIGVNGLTITFQ